MNRTQEATTLAGRAVIGLTAVAVGALALTGGSTASTAGTSGTPNGANVGFAQISGGSIKGLVVAHRQRANRVRVYVSLHGVPVPSGGQSEYSVVAATRPCGQLVDAADYVVFRTNIIMANTEGDFVKRTRTRRRWRAVRSVRLFEVVQGQQPVERACGVARG